MKVLRDDAAIGAAQGVQAQVRLRIDKWLWHARFFKTRGLAARFVGEARLRVDGRVVDKPSAAVGFGNVLTFGLGDRVRIVRVVALGARRGPPSEARTLYDDLDQPVRPAGQGNDAAVILAPSRRTG